jgi:hypothetical protein
MVVSYLQVRHGCSPWFWYLFLQCMWQTCFSSCSKVCNLLF